MSRLSRLVPCILYLWLVLSLVIPNILLSITERMNVAMAAANVLLPLGLIGIGASLSSRISRTVWLMLPLAVLGVFQIVLLGLYGRSVIAVDMFLNVVTTNSAEAGELLAGLWPVITVTCILYLPLPLMGIYVARHNMKLAKGFRTTSRRISSIAACGGLISLAVCYMAPQAYAMNNDLYPVNAGYNCYLAIDRTQRTSLYHTTSQGYSYNARSTHPDSLREICVLVVGETSRAANWSLFGYDRPTNPLLSRRKQGIFTAPQTYSESNTTHKAVPMLLSPVNAETYETDIYLTRSLITAFNEAGWHTAFVSAQSPNRSFIEYFGNEADTTVYINHDNYDFGLLPVLDSLLRQGNRKQLVVLHTYGSHYSYRDRYGETDRKFVPDDYSEPTAAQRDRLINAYDNTIVATDRLLDNIINRLEDEHCVASMLYSSDHGEDIFDDGRHFLHAGPIPSVNQVHVAMLAWLSPEYETLFATETNMLATNFAKRVSSSRSYCPTALGLAGINSNRVQPNESLVSAEYAPKKAVYLNDHNEAVALADITNR